MSRDAARRLLETDPSSHAMADIFLFASKESPMASSLATFQVCPAPCIQDKFFHKDQAQIVFKSTIDQPAGPRSSAHGLAWRSKLATLARIAQGYRRILFAA
jgi:glycosyl transferase, family 25